MTGDRFRWVGGGEYESFVGRWSRLVAQMFVRWLELEAGARVVDVGCGTGALTTALLELADPEAVVGVDPSAGFIDHAREQTTDPRATFAVAGAESLPFEDGAFDVAVSGLVLNFVPDAARGVAESARVVRRGGCVAAYVWDYAGRMELLRQFWDAAVGLDPAAGALDEGRLFPICEPVALAELFAGAGLLQAETREIVVPTVFSDFDDYWQPFSPVRPRRPVTRCRSPRSGGALSASASASDCRPRQTARLRSWRAPGRSGARRKACSPRRGIVRRRERRACGCRPRGRQLRRKRKWAATYSPGRLPSEYHRPWRA